MYISAPFQFLKVAIFLLHKRLICTSGHDSPIVVFTISRSFQIMGHDVGMQGSHGNGTPKLESKFEYSITMRSKVNYSTSVLHPCQEGLTMLLAE